MHALILNFKNFIIRAGHKILQVPDTPKEFVGQYLLSAYLDQSVQTVGASIRLEVQTGRDRADIIITHRQKQYIIETKIWRDERRYQIGKKQLLEYLKSENAAEGYYVVFDHRETPIPKVEIETIDNLKVQSYVIPVVQKIPSQVLSESRPTYMLKSSQDKEITINEKKTLASCTP